MRSLPLFPLPDVPLLLLPALPRLYLFLFLLPALALPLSYLSLFPLPVLALSLLCLALFPLPAMALLYLCFSLFLLLLLALPFFLPPLNLLLLLALLLLSAQSLYLSLAIVLFAENLSFEQRDILPCKDKMIPPCQEKMKIIWLVLLGFQRKDRERKLTKQIEKDSGFNRWQQQRKKRLFD